MSGKTDGRRAYDAWWATAEGVPRHPDVTYDQDGAAWEAAAAAGAAAAHERTAELLSEVNGLRAERDSLRQDNDRISELLEKTSVAKCDAMDERDRLTERVAGVVTEGNKLREELAKVRNALAMLASIVHADVLVMEAAAIEMRKGDTHAAMQWILNAMPDCWDGEPGTEWNGRETAQEWFDRQPGVQDEQPGPAVVTAGTEHLVPLIRDLTIPDEL